MNILRRRKAILVFLILVWIGGMAYFLTNISGKDDTISETYQADVLDRNSNEDILLREKQEHRQTREHREEKEESQVSSFEILLMSKSSSVLVNILLFVVWKFYLKKLASF